MGRARAKKRRRKARPRRPRSAGKARQALWIAAVVLVIAFLLWLGYAGFEDRHWSAFKEAGDRAFGRENYAYAQRMYDAALDEAERVDPDGEKVVQTLLALSSTHKALGEPMLAEAMLDRARTLRARRGR